MWHSRAGFSVNFIMVPPWPMSKATDTRNQRHPAGRHQGLQSCRWRRHPLFLSDDGCVGASCWAAGQSASWIKWSVYVYVCVQRCFTPIEKTLLIFFFNLARVKTEGVVSLSPYGWCSFRSQSVTTSFSQACNLHYKRQVSPFHPLLPAQPFNMKQTHPLGARTHTHAQARYVTEIMQLM